MIYTNEEARKKWVGVNFYGEYFFIREGADIGEGAVIRERAVIREGAVITTVYSRFVGNISPTKSRMFIRIGCEIHTIEEWDEHGVAYARKDSEAEWWKQHGKYMYEFLKGEAKRYDDTR